MQITCPACQAAYDVPDARLSPGRSVRCARCGERWMPLGAAPPPVVGREAAPAAPAEPPMAPPSPAAPRPGVARDVVAEAESPPASPPRGVPPAETRQRPIMPRPEERETDASPPRSQGALALAWVASALAVMGAGMVAVVWRAEVMEAWPPAVRVYRALGLG